jgi:TPR repeat protein
MNHTRSARTALAAVAGLGAALLAACASPGAASPHAGYEEQACAEQALRRSPHPAILDGAEESFTLWCGLGDAASCSMLGVMYEAGAGVARDPRRALALYQRACSAGNARACTNLGAALTAACQRGDGAACARLDPWQRDPRPRAVAAFGRER